MFRLALYYSKRNEVTVGGLIFFAGYMGKKASKNVLAGNVGSVFASDVGSISKGYVAAVWK